MNHPAMAELLLITTRLFFCS